MGLGEITANLGEKAKDLLSACTEFIRSHLRIVMIAASALLVIILALLILVLADSQKTQSENVPSAGAADTLPSEMFAADDFFLPYEPDFVPDVLLDREPKDGWTEEDARPFWTDPLEGSEKTWQNRIESGIDSLLEHIP